MSFDAPIGSEIAAALLIILASVLALATKRILGAGGEQAVQLPSDRTRAEDAVLRRIDDSEKNPWPAAHRGYHPG